MDWKRDGLEKGINVPSLVLENSERSMGHCNSPAPSLCFLRMKKDQWAIDEKLGFGEHFGFGFC